MEEWGLRTSTSLPLDLSLPPSFRSLPGFNFVIYLSMYVFVVGQNLSLNTNPSYKNVFCSLYFCVTKHLATNKCSSSILVSFVVSVCKIWDGFGVRRGKSLALVVFQCMMQSWYLAVDMQLFLLSPVVLYPLSRSPRVGLLILTLLFVFSLVVPFWVAFDYQIKTPIPISMEWVANLG